MNQISKALIIKPFYMEIIIATNITIKLSILGFSFSALTERKDVHWLYFKGFPL
jgi:hypothetical protein